MFEGMETPGEYHQVWTHNKKGMYRHVGKVRAQSAFPASAATSQKAVKSPPDTWSTRSDLVTDWHIEEP